ncbi:GGDEF domain-containing response regulator [Lignipirellula cremea]|uniref:diguanylate cyclase n=1 Tax=Lignipirellula cremea TaxID=2528010 RepID=A0A518DSN4_9BACT|nr:diguanylate cyclase [Lignipirellula cremea]QDU94850.1 Response regulator PleD [Lignipirellula cremea]
MASAFDLDSNLVSILLVEDDEADAALVERLLLRSSECNFVFSTASTLAAALRLVHENEFHVILLDLGLPDSQGLDAVHCLHASSPETPIVVFTGHEEEETALQAIHSGAQEYLSKSHLMSGLLQRVIRHSIARQRKLQQALTMSLVDSLTGVGNRRLFDTEISRRLKDWERHQISFCLAMLDIDHFKKVNDTFGHASGDSALRATADIVQSNLRSADSVMRFGGEEFAILMPITALEPACLVIERIRERVALNEIPAIGENVHISAGIAQIQHADSLQGILERADSALYAAKSNGRDCCFVNNGNESVHALSLLATSP